MADEVEALVRLKQPREMVSYLLCNQPIKPRKVHIKEYFS